MQLDEIVEENSIETISKRTRISVENIEKLLRRDFSTLNRVKALGFISILEREFNTDMSSLRKECLDYFPDKQKVEIVDTKKVVDVQMPKNRDQNGSFGKVVFAVIVAAIAATAWYYLSADKQNDNISAVEVDKNISTEKSNKKKQSKPKEIKKPSLKPIPVFARKEDNLANQDNNKSEAVKSTLSEEEKIISEIKNKTQEQIAKDNTTNKEINYDDMPAIEPAKDTDKNETITKEAKKTKSVKKTVSKVVLHPTKKLWIGYTNLDTMQRSTRLTESDVEFAPNKKGWIVVTGHSGLNFVVGDKTITSDKKGKAYFLIKKGSVKPISQEEFQKLNKSTVW